LDRRAHIISALKKHHWAIPVRHGVIFKIAILTPRI